MKDRRFVEKRLTDEQAELAGEYWEKAIGLAKLHAKNHRHLDLDWETAAAFGLCDAAFRFDPTLGNKFWTYASHRIQFAFIDLMRVSGVRGYGRTQNYEGAPVIQSIDFDYSISGRASSFAATIEAEEDTPGWELRSVEEVYGLTNRLASPAKDVVRLYYCHGLTLKQTGERLGFSESRASQLHSQAIEFLREAIHPESIAC